MNEHEGFHDEDEIPMIDPLHSKNIPLTLDDFQETYNLDSPSKKNNGGKTFSKQEVRKGQIRRWLMVCPSLSFSLSLSLAWFIYVYYCYIVASIT